MEEKKPSFRRKTSFWIIVVAAVVLEATACLQYFCSQYAIKKGAETRARIELRSAELEINVHTAELEAAAKSLAMMAQYNIKNPQAMYACTRILLQTIDNVESAGVAFRADYYKQHGRWYEVCSSRTGLEGDAAIYTRQIGGPNHDYLNAEWFQSGMISDSCWWSEPYLDDAGAKTMVVSCTYPIYDPDGSVAGVVCIDMSLDKLTHISKYLQVYKDSYYSITSNKGIHITDKPDTIPGRKYMIFDEEVDATGWKISIIIPEDILYADLKKLGLLVTVLMLLGLALLIFIVYRAGRDIKRLMDVNSQKERMLRELEIARNIQMAMLPKTFPPYHNRPDLSMYGLILPAKEVGGDLYDFYERDNKLFFCVGDVSGKGIPASLVMAMTRSIFRSISAHEHDVAMIAGQMNNLMSESNEMNMFVTLFIGVMDLKTGDLNYCNAGHNAPVLIERTKSSEDGKQVETELLPTIPNLPLGILSGYTYTPQTTTIHHCDTLFLYTDGLTEAENIHNEQFGEERMLKTLSAFENKQTDYSDPKKAQEEVETMLAAVHEFVGEAEQSDDLTMLVIKRLTTEGEPDKEEAPLKHSIIMRNDIQQIPTLAEWIEGLSIPDALNMTINLALEEAVTNVMLYAYPNGAGKVLIEAERDKEKITFVISDHGIPFDPTQSPEADISLSAEERAIGGLGIHLVRQIMDDIHYERKDDMNVLTLVKMLNC